MLLHLLLLSAKLDDYKYKNCDDDDDDVPNHNCLVEDRSIAVMGAGEGEPPIHNGASDG